MLGIAYAPHGGRRGAQLVTTAVERKTRVDESAGALYKPAGYLTLDLLVHADIGPRLRLNAAVFNLTDQKYRDGRMSPAVRPPMPRSIDISGRA